jgi:hypothetical protein
VTEAPPTSDQLRNIFDYVSPSVKASDIIKGAQNKADALKLLSENGGDRFIRPVVSFFHFRFESQRLLSLVSLLFSGCLKRCG